MGTHELISRYFAKSLSDAEEAVVETRVVENAAFRDEFEITAALRQGMKDLESRGEIPHLLAANGTGRRATFAVAAAAAAAAVGLAILYATQEQASRPPTSVVLVFERTRGDAGADVSWRQPRAPVRLAMRFDVGANPAPAYRATLQRLPARPEIPALETSVATSPDGDVVLEVDSQLLSPGNYEIRLQPDSPQPVDDLIVYRLIVEN
jgi:hypothetical protein